MVSRLESEVFLVLRNGIRADFELEGHVIEPQYQLVPIRTNVNNCINSFLLL